jgi:hypothetical protein
MFKKTFCSIMLLFITTLLYAGPFSFNVSADKNTVALNESFTYSVTVSADGKNLPQHQIDAMPEFTKYGQSTSQEISIINGKANTSITYRYTLAPKRMGKFTIPPAKIIFDNKTHLTESIEVEVTPAKKSADHNQKSGSNHHKNAFVRASVNKKTVYENEKLVYKFGFYANVNLASNSNDYSSPDFSGFWNDGSKQRESYFQVVDGLKYIASETETVLYPIGAGLKTISPAKFEIEVPDTVDNFFSGFGSFMNIGRSQTKILETEKIEVKVLPLPQEGKPYDFSGGVGDFKIKGSVDKKDASTNDPITLTVTVSGEGNMKSIKDIKFNSCDGFKKYDTIVANTSDNSKEFKTIFIPLTAGEKEIPYASLSFFNPAKKQYEDVKTQPLKITVSAKPSYFNDATSNDATFSDIAKNTSKINKVRNDINYNKQIKELKLYNGHFIKNPAFYLMFVPFIVLLFFSIGYRLHVNRTRGNKSKKLKGYSFANVFKLIHEAQTNIANDSFNIALSKIYEALIEIVNIKTGILSANLQSLQISSNLAESGVGNEIISKILGVLERINFYKFASSSPDKDSLNALIGEVRAIVANLKK